MTSSDDQLRMSQRAGRVAAAGTVRVASRARRRYERNEVRRFMQHRIRRRRGWGIALAAVVLLLAFVGLAVFTPLMSVRTIQVVGTNRLDAAKVQAALQPLEGKPLAQVRNADVQALLDQFVLMQSYTVQRTPPSTLVVRVVERVPIGVQSGTSQVVDAAGVVLWQRGGDGDTGERTPLPTIDAGKLGSAAFLAAGRVSLALPEDFRAQVSKITAVSPEDIELVLDTGVSVKWGSSDESQRKAYLLTALIPATKGMGVSSYDVSSPATPVSR